VTALSQGVKGGDWYGMANSPPPLPRGGRAGLHIDGEFCDRNGMPQQNPSRKVDGAFSGDVNGGRARLNAG
jgi:hypothetical protein